MTRRTTAGIAMVMLILLVGADLISAPPNPYQQPAIVALGSGAASAGGFCGALPE
ncbi:hypothetical protein ACUNV4_14900 [Granulosicoccus sp. 3-233]|uniref:hypothetical protein n=1 Tax=Granulosicoccus sp. 3-233 TaxID=3417969 RepID=UPI003D33F4AE